MTHPNHPNHPNHPILDATDVYIATPDNPNLLEPLNPDTGEGIHLEPLEATNSTFDTFDTVDTEGADATGTEYDIIQEAASTLVGEVLAKITAVLRIEVTTYSAGREPHCRLLTPRVARRHLARHLRRGTDFTARPIQEISIAGIPFCTAAFTTCAGHDFPTTTPDTF